MPDQNCQSDPSLYSIPVVPLPVALYVSEGLIFELYNGGKRHRQFLIRWERLNPTVTQQHTGE